MSRKQSLKPIKGANRLPVVGVKSSGEFDSMLAPTVTVLLGALFGEAQQRSSTAGAVRSQSTFDLKARYEHYLNRCSFPR